MSRYSINAYDVATGAVVDTYKTLVGLELAASETIEVRRIVVSGGGEASADRQISVRLTTSDQSTAGTATSRTPSKFDARSQASIVTGKVNYSAEPTTVETSDIKAQASFNARGQLILDWAKGEGPQFTGASTVILQATPGDANATALVVQVEWDEL